MPKFFVNKDQIEEENIRIMGPDVNHIKNVLRKKVGDELIIGEKELGRTYVSVIEKIEETTIQAKIIDVVSDVVETNLDLTIFQGLPKGEKMELIIQKSTELGVKKIVPVNMKRCVVKLDEKTKKKKQERWQKIAEVAAKQSGRDRIPEIENAKNLKEIVTLFSEYDVILIAYENERENAIKEELKRISGKNTSKNYKIGVIIGPEGGIAEEEIEMLKEMGAKSITLGKRILRTETVAMVITSIILYEFDELK